MCIKYHGTISEKDIYGQSILVGFSSTIKNSTKTKPIKSQSLIVTGRQWTLTTYDSLSNWIRWRNTTTHVYFYDFVSSIESTSSKPIS